MFSLLYGLYKYLSSKDEYYILVVGLDNSGKTTFLENAKALYKGIEPLSAENIMPTVGLNICRVIINNVNLIFWDLGGSKELRSIWEKYYTSAQGVIFVVDSANQSRFQESKEELQKLLQGPNKENVPILILANKQDLPNASKIPEIESSFGITVERGEKKFDGRGVMVQPLKAIKGEGIKDSIELLVDVLKTRGIKPATK